MEQKRIRTKFTEEDKAYIYNTIETRVAQGEYMKNVIQDLAENEYPTTTEKSLTSLYYRERYRLEEEAKQFQDNDENKLKEEKLQRPDLTVLVDYITGLEEENAYLKKKIQEVEDDYTNVMTIISKAREIAIGDVRKHKFKMDSNGNLERLED